MGWFSKKEVERTWRLKIQDDITLEELAELVSMLFRNLPSIVNLDSHKDYETIKRHFREVTDDI